MVAIGKNPMSIKPAVLQSAQRTVIPGIRAMLSPKSVALIGASESPGSVGLTILENLRAAKFAGSICLVNPKHDRVLGIRTFPSISAVPDPVDLAVIVTPAVTVPGIIEECAKAGVRGAVIISAGFREVGAVGIELEREVLRRRGAMRIIGPNCLGVMLPHVKLNATFAAGMARPGSVGFLSQSGALCTAILDWSLREEVGFSAFVSVGSMADVKWGDLIYQLGDDPHTRSIVMYMESIGDARSFLSAAREVALTKPIIVLKVGRTEAAARAAASHTGSLTGSDDVLDAAFRRVGVLRVDTIAELEENTTEIVIPPNEFSVDTFRSGGKGGQNVNKVETAVRITHVPTGLVVASQAQRSQAQNRATAMKLLLSRIFAQRQDAAKAEMERFYGEKGSVSWGNQIRSYVFQPYRMVKDLRTGVETSNVQGVMDGDLDPFVNGWLRAGCPLKRMQGVKDDEE